MYDKKVFQLSRQAIYRKNNKRKTEVLYFLVRLVLYTAVLREVEVGLNTKSSLTLFWKIFTKINMVIRSSPGQLV